ncbi:thioredoxin family protein [Rhodoferax sp.]|uniref:thioredoxin family protein n=1 Tax=Rhodoferax sp. TaxID=50421 RepID=UPI00275FAFF4|nr:hypothetical protein [Rhodoferax sp.]
MGADARLNRRAAVSRVLGIGAACLAPVGRAAEATLPLSESLLAELTQALRAGGPLIVMVSLEACAFCKVAREHHLAPLRSQQALGVVQLDMRSSRPVLDFKGSATTHGELVARWQVKVAPTLLFFGRGGTEVAERLQGVSIPDYYGAILDDRLRSARLAL